MNALRFSRAWSRRSVSLLSLGGLLGVFLVIPVPPAWSLDCSAEQIIFTFAPASTTADGVKNRSFLRDRDLNSACAGQDSLAWDTTHVENAAHTMMAEIGWSEFIGAGSSHDFRYFYEAGSVNNPNGSNSNGPATASGVDVDMKLLSVKGNNNWQFYVDWNIDGTFEQIGPTDGMWAGFDNGVPMGETGRRGGTATGASDHQFQLKKKTCRDCAWTAWSDNGQWSDSISNWSYHQLATDAYEIVKDK